MHNHHDIGGAHSRRTLLKALVAGAAIGSLPLRTRAQRAELRWWTPQGAPAQLDAYRFQIAAFEALHPGVTVVLEPLSDEGYAPQLAAAFSSGQVPDVVTHLPSFSVQSYYAKGLVEPFDDVIEAIGPDDFYPGANDVFRAADGRHVACGIGNSAVNILWLRTDIMQRVGLERAPETWDEFRDALQKLQGRGIYGTALPYGRNTATSLVFIGFIHGAGGQVFTPDLEVAIDSEATRNALEFYREIRDFSPIGATNYSWGEGLTAFVSGATATGLYTGRVLANVNDQNPRLSDHITCALWPTMTRDIPPWTFNDFPSVFIPAQSGNKDLARRLAAFLFEPEGYIRQLHAAPGHVLPVLQSIGEDPRYRDNAIIRKYRKETDLMAQAAANGFNLGYESSAHRSNEKAGEVIASGAIADMVQRVVLNRENVDRVLADTTRAIAAVMAR
ncbi:ABC transporter substrate-binding protein [Chromatocurvus halotolerans]|uniref:Multiple sugar transport system substrate-binding protein n=1 Tax=Chromatocurvus halotolerans TaxID=1132028 RepID=A0A4R2KT70_9GAMM|nr:extracellular solute-binding protein [Chromatocurvus halotolerans]TCO77004.1 multiple sugar transport system substrate-binding protein [Chromatocurvus halotolerans]